MAFFSNMYSYTCGNIPLILGGDFNCVLLQGDRSDISSNTSCFVGRKELNSFLKSYDLVDTWIKSNPSDKGHTWCHSGKGQSSRIDRIYVNENFNIENVSKINFHLSDHDAVSVIVNIPNQTNKKFKSYWKFNVLMCEDELFVKDFIFYYDMWRTLKPGFESITDWWENVKSRIKELSIFHGVRRARERRQRLESLQKTCLSGNKDAITNLLREERRGAFVRSREKFLEEREQPGGYFHKIERANAESKLIKEVRNAQGNIVSGDDVTPVFYDFYTKLYTPDTNVDNDLQDVFIDSLSEIISDEKAELMDKPIDLSEIKNALSLMPKNKSPGIDGLPVEFYVRFFDVIGNDLLAVYNEIFCNQLLSKTQRTAVITLLPKKGDTLDPANRRPISLLTVDYKVIAKILQLRISNVMADIVNAHQTCSVPGRCDPRIRKYV